MGLGIALSGGGVRGAAHIGVLKALEENNIKPKYISGASAGSIVAALYAVGYTPSEIEKIFIEISSGIVDFDFSGILNFIEGAIVGKKNKLEGFINGSNIENLIEGLVVKKGVNSFSKTKIPLAISSVDINSSETVMHTSIKIPNSDGVIYDSSAKISEAVRASISFPGIFKPKILKGRRLVDGGVRNNIPANVLKKMGARKVIGVNLGYCGEPDNTIDSVFEIITQSIDIMAYSIFKYECKDIDLLLKPRIYNVKLLELERIPECIKRGYEYGINAISSIKGEIDTYKI